MERTKNHVPIRRKNSEDDLDYLHRLAKSGVGLKGLQQAAPRASESDLTYWLETHGYKQ